MAIKKTIVPKPKTIQLIDGNDDKLPYSKIVEQIIREISADGYTMICFCTKQHYRAIKQFAKHGYFVFEEREKYPSCKSVSITWWIHHPESMHSISQGQMNSPLKNNYWGQPLPDDFTFYT